MKHVTSDLWLLASFLMERGGGLEIKGGAWCELHPPITTAGFLIRAPLDCEPLKGMSRSPVKGGGQRLA